MKYPSNARLIPKPGWKPKRGLSEALARFSTARALARLAFLALTKNSVVFSAAIFKLSGETRDALIDAVKGDNIPHKAYEQSTAILTLKEMVDKLHGRCAQLDPGPLRERYEAAIDSIDHAIDGEAGVDLSLPNSES